MRGEPETILEQMLQHWASEGGFVLLKFIEPIIIICMLHVLCLYCIKRNSTLGGYLHLDLEHLQNDVRPEIYIYIYI